MLVKPLSEKYLEDLVDVVDEYREFCGFGKRDEATKAFFKRILKTTMQQHL